MLREKYVIRCEEAPEAVDDLFAIKVAYVRIQLHLEDSLWHIVCPLEVT